MADAEPDHDIATVFDQASYWRAEIVAEFRLRGSERCAAASPTPGFPQLLDSVGFALADAPPGPLLDVGGGLGGTASWSLAELRRVPPPAVVWRCPICGRRRRRPGRHGQHPQYGAWRRDLEHLDRVVAARQVVPAAMVLG